eukprot:SAG31_NODE_31612_length_366_cov_0.741573_1_plen_79_part_01
MDKFVVIGLVASIGFRRLANHEFSSGGANVTGARQGQGTAGYRAVRGQGNLPGGGVPRLNEEPPPRLLLQADQQGSVCF